MLYIRDCHTLVANPEKDAVDLGGHIEPELWARGDPEAEVEPGSGHGEIIMDGLVVGCQEVKRGLLWGFYGLFRALRVRE